MDPIRHSMQDLSRQLWEVKSSAKTRKGVPARALMRKPSANPKATWYLIFMWCETNIGRSGIPLQKGCQMVKLHHATPFSYKYTLRSLSWI